jgi:hypothetical protein
MMRFGADRIKSIEIMKVIEEKYPAYWNLYNKQHHIQGI